MRVRLMLPLFALLLCAMVAQAELIDLGTGSEGIDVTVLESTDARTVVRFDIGTYSRTSIKINDETYYGLSLGMEHVLLNQAEPALPRISRSIIIPDDAHMSIRILDSKYVDFPNTPVAPSKGNLKRTVNPDDVPYEFGPVYQENTWYPGAVADIREPYILRDYRGTVIDCNSFQYNPVTQTLRVFTSITVEVSANGPGEINVLQHHSRNAIVQTFDDIYTRRFINYDFQTDKYVPVGEYGDMLIITYDGYRSAMEPFVAWKEQKGIKTYMVDVSDIGNNGTSIDNYIQQFYDADSTNLAFVLLVGDHAQVNKPIGSGNSDPVYSKVAGGDNYPDILIGRFSAESLADAQTQVQRTITYESDPIPGEWFHKGVGIGSNDSGTGQGGEHDWEHENLIRADLLNFTYTQVDQLYEMDGITTADISASLNDGRGIVNYTGHGSATSWGTTGYSNSNVNALVNDNMLPFIISVACNNGQFDTYTCFGEAWLRATHNGAPTGAIGFYGSLISQSWSPPMDCQDEVVDVLCAMQKFTYGGLCFNGACKMIDLNGSTGVSEFNAWTVFGDPSVQVWSDTPAPMTVSHEDVVLFTETEFPVQVPGIENALCALYKDGTLFGSAYTDATGAATIPIAGSLPVGEEVTLTVTYFNKQVYTAGVMSISPDGPYVVYADNTIDDAVGGNGNGLIDYGESVVLGVEFKNVGPDTAHNITAVLTTSDPYITITDDTELYGDIAGDFETSYIADAFAFDVAANTPDNHTILFMVTMTETSRDSVWTSDINLTVHAPALYYVTVAIDDNLGNNNGVLDPGETADLIVTLQNAGSGQADDVVATISTSDMYISIGDDAGDFGQILSGASGENETNVFSATADAGCPRGHEVTFQMNIGAINGFTGTAQFTVIVGDRVLFFSDDFSFNQGWSGLSSSGGEWTIGPATGGAGSDSYGGPDPATDHSPGSDNGVLGTDLTSGTGGDYNASLSTTYWVTSPPLDCGDFNGVQLYFHRWLGIERNSYDHASLQVFDGSSWQTIFQNGSENLEDGAWVEQMYDVSAYADSNGAFQLRFGIGSSDGSMQYCGWNIDDLYLKGYGERTSADMAVDAETVIDSLIPGDEMIDTVMVYNLSTEAVLRVSFSPDVSWMSCNEEQCLVDPESSMAFPFTLTTAGLAPGDYVGHLMYACNDYTHQYDTVEVLMHLYAPDISISMTSIEETMSGGEQSTHDITIDNIGPGRLEFSVGCQMFNKNDIFAKATAPREPIGERPADNGKSSATESFYAPTEKSFGGPDGFGYLWTDSDEPGGPTFAWVDISGAGTSVTLGDDDMYGPIALGFDFPYYENTYNELYIGSNGIITFGEGSGSRINTALPTATVPNNMIAMWWDDLDPGEGGNVYYYYDAAEDQFIVSFVAIQNYISGGGTGLLNFQAILKANGQILLQYATMDPGEDTDGLLGASLGIENATGTDGLEVCYNAAYLHDNLAISFKASRWLSVSPASGTIEPYSSGVVTVTLDATELEEGVFTGQVVIASNDPETTQWPIPVSVTIESFVCGDANGDGDLNVADAVHLINYVFKGGAAPDPLEAGDANGDGDVNVADAVYLINFVFSGGPGPIC